MAERKLLVGDERTGGVECKTCKKVMKLFGEIKENNESMLMVRHSNMDG
ncbi:hypothetical protein [Staphylococcus capitis]|nr:hypothetical protein [Staphylococcus capitis]